MSKSYHEKQDIKNARLLNERLEDLPPFSHEFFVGKADTLASKTKLAYAYDFSIFFNYLIEYEEDFQGIFMNDFSLEDLSRVLPDHIERYMAYLSFYENEDGIYQNREKGKARKLASVRTLYNYFYKKGKVNGDPSRLVDFPTLHEKTITRLEIDEVAKLLDAVESGENLTEKQKEYHEKTKVRDLAIITLLLGTGLRVSECVGIDIRDLDFDINGVRITRKGGDQEIVYFGDEVRDTLIEYYNERINIDTIEGHEQAFFLSLQNRRISSRAVQKLVKKYSKGVTPLKNISPHKLRSTFGTNLYNETGDIYLVASVLGHSDVNTTRKHYAAMEEQRKRDAANAINLRKEE